MPLPVLRLKKMYENGIARFQEFEERLKRLEDAANTQKKRQKAEPQKSGELAQNQEQDGVLDQVIE